MTQDEFDNTLDDATHAVLQAFNLKFEENFGTAYAINDALTQILQHLRVDEENQ